MKISREDVDPCQVKLSIEVEPKRLSVAMAAVTQELSKRYRIPGFRPGKAPMDRVAALVGEANLRQEALERLGKEVVGAAIKAEKLQSVAPMTMEVLSTDPPRFSVVISLEPEVDLGDYLSLRLPEPELPEPTEDDVERVLGRMQRDLAERRPVDRPARRGDELVLSVEARRRSADAPPPAEEDGELLPEDAPRQRLFLDDALARFEGAPEGLVEALVGLSAGSAGSFSLPVPADADAPTAAEGAAERLDFSYRLHEVVELELPPLDDSLAARLGGAESLEAVRERLRTSLEERRDINRRELLVRAAREALVAGATLRYPPALVQEELRETVTAFRRYLEQEGEDWETWLAARDEEQLWREFEERAEQTLRRKLVLSRFAEVEGLEPEERQVEAGLRYAEQLGSRRPRKAREGLRRMMLDSLNHSYNQRVDDRLLAIVSGDAAPTAS